jgi:aryl-alcohol dehydrogenase-like predicted oxidoreductase
MSFEPLAAGPFTKVASWRSAIGAHNPRFAADNLEQNLRIVAEAEAVAAETGATPAQVALAWLLAQGADIVPIPRHQARPGWKRTPPPAWY